MQQLHKLKNFLGNTGVTGGRHHFLVFKPPITWRIWEQAGLKYDSTIGFFDHEGFRCGICLPFRPFDAVEQREMNVWELPITVMDCTLDKYRRLSPVEAKFVLRKLLKKVKKYRGVFVLLWHNTYFGEQNGGRFHEVFADLVQEAIRDGAFVGPARDVIPF